jgi:hypothetical protein
MLPTKFGFILESGFREEDLWNFSQSEHIIGPGSHIEYPTGTKNSNFVEDHPRNIPAKYWTLWENVQMPSSQKLQIWLKPNCTWMFIGRSSTISRFCVPIWNSKWRLRQDLVSHIEYPTGTKNSNFVEDHPGNIPAKFGSNRPSSFGEEAWNVKSLQTTDDRD